MTVEVITCKLDDHGGGLAKINGNIRLIEGLVLPDEKIEFGLSYYNTNTFWIDIDQLLTVFGLTREELNNPQKVKPFDSSLVCHVRLRYLDQESF